MFVLLKSFFRPHRRVLAIAASLILISRVCTFVGPACLGHIINELNKRRTVPDLAILAITMVTALAIEIRTSQYGSRKLAFAANEIGAEIRSSLQSHVLQLPASFFDSERLGSLVSTIIGDTQHLQSMLGETIATRAIKLFESLLGLAYLYFLSPTLAAVGTVLIAAGILWTAQACRKVVPLSRHHKAESVHCAALSTDLVNGIRTIKGHTTEAYHSELFAKVCKQLAETSVHLHEAVTSSYGQGSFFLGFSVPVTIALGTELVLHRGLSVGDLAIYMVVLWRILWPFMDMLALSTDIAAGYAGIERICAILAHPIETAGSAKTHCPTNILGHIEMREICFSYNNHFALRKFNCKFSPGTINALVGPSGSGKSTVLSLLAGFYQPTAGTVLIDGLPLSSLDMSSYRRHVAYVHQNSFIFPGTIRENILIADPHASEDRLRFACETAGISTMFEDVSLLESRDMGEQGMRFSGGQRQRIAIARALLKDPAILLLDEATANLDVRADTLIQRALVNLMRSRTTIIVAHRLSTIRHADQIIVLGDGEIVGVGTHTSLLHNNAHYRSLYDEEFWIAEHLGA